MDEKRILLYIVAIVILAVVVEATFFVIAYVNADEVKCNWIWCEFTTERTNITERTYVDQKCYSNDVEVNCSELADMEIKNLKWWNN